ncbi:MAG TPA: hypothetical protein VMX35_12180 [Acidobacteriota bacterium]|nr:hypothetical protein [Acidobacteriota bacterium]
MTSGTDKPGIIIAAALFLVMAVISTWPLATDLGHLDLAAKRGNDPRFNTYVVFWGAHALLTDPLNLHHTNMFHPERYTLAYSDIELSSSLLMLPAILIWYNPVLTYNLLVFASIFLGGIGFFLLAYDLTSSRGAALFGAAVFVFNPAHFGRYLQIQFFADQWLPWTAWALLRWLRGRHWGWAAAAALLYCLHALTGSHNAVFGAVFIGLALLYYAVSDKLWKRARFWGGTALIAAVSAIILLPVFWPYMIVEKDLEVQRVENFDALRAGSAGAYELLSAGSQLYNWIDDNLKWPSAFFSGRLRGFLFPGFVALFLSLTAFLNPNNKGKGGRRTKWIAWTFDTIAIAAAWIAVLRAISGSKVVYLLLVPIPSPPAWLIALVALAAVAARLIWMGGYSHVVVELFRWLKRSLWIDKHKLFWLIVLLFGLIAALGPDAGLYQILGRMPLIKLIRVPRRFILLATFALAMLAAWGFAVMMRKLSKSPLRIILAFTLVVLFSAEALYAPLRVFSFDPNPPELYKWLGRQQGDFAVAEFPVDPLNYGGNMRRVYLSIHHWKKLLVGYSGYQSQENKGRLARLNRTFPSDECIEELRSLNVRYVIVLADRLAADQRDALRSQAQLAFENNFHGAMIYRVRTSAK